MRVLVTGCAGLLGSNFCEYLLENIDNIEIIGVDDLSGGYIENVDKRVKFLKANLTDKADQKIIEKEFKDGYIDYIFAYAAIACEGLSPFIRQYTFMNNAVANAFLINCGIKYKIKRFVYTSSMAVYGKGQVPFSEDLVPNPIDTYGIAKYACEMDLKVAYEQHGLEYCIIRPHNVYGKYQNIWDPYRNVLGIWMYNALHNKPFTIYGDGEQTRAFSYIDDILPCLWNAAIKDHAKNEIVNVGGMQHKSLNDAKDILSKIHSRDKLKFQVTQIVEENI
jgi:UDP-glucose 4-epimerase